MSGIRRQIFQSVGVSLYCQLALIATGILTARLLGVEQRGIFLIATTVPLVVAQLASLGMPQAMAFLLADDRNRVTWFVAKFRTWLVWQICVVALIQMPLIAVLLQDELSVPHVLIAAISASGAVALLVKNYLLGLMQGLRWFLLLNLARVVIVTYLMILLSFAGYLGLRSTEEILVIWVLANVLTISTVGILIVKKFRNGAQLAKRDASSSEINSVEVVRRGISDLLGAASPLDRFRLDQVFAIGLLNAHGLGLYAVAVSFTGFQRLIFDGIGMVLMPHVAAMREKADIRRILYRTLILASVINIFVALGLIAILPYLVPMLFGEEFSQAIVAAQFLVGAAGVAASRRVFVDVLRGGGHTRAGSLSEGIMYPVLLVLGIWMSSNYGVTGFAASLCITKGVGFLTAVTIGISWIRLIPDVNQTKRP